MSRQNQWFVPGDGIAREVITADIQRYLGPDALVRPGPGNGEYEGRAGYWITAYRTLTSQMIQDLKLDSQRWQQEQGRQEAGRGVAYQDSRTHAARQHWGPSESFSGGRGEAPRPSTNQQQYTPNEHYTTTPGTYPSAHGNPPSQGYASTHTQGYGTTPAYGTSVPRTNPNPDPYAGYSQPGRDHSGYGAPQQYASGYSSSASQDPYGGRGAPPPAHGYAPAAPSPVAAPGYYIASDGRQYPLPAPQPQPSRGSRGSGRSA